MKAEYINPFINAAINTISTMASTVSTPGQPYLKADKKTFGTATGVIGMGGPALAGNMAISFDEACILGIVSRMFMEDITTIDDDILDAVGELTNVIAGVAKKEMSERGLVFDMATPFMLKGQGVEVAQFAKIPIVVVPFKTEFGSFVVESNLAPIDRAN